VLGVGALALVMPLTPFAEPAFLLGLQILFAYTAPVVPKESRFARHAHAHHRRHPPAGGDRPDLRRAGDPAA
jgi:hypothetical protein